MSTSSRRPLPGRVWRTRAGFFGLFAALVGLLVLLLSFPMLLSDPAPGQPDEPWWFDVVFGAGVLLFLGGGLAFVVGVLSTLVLALVAAVRSGHT